MGEGATLADAPADAKRIFEGEEPVEVAGKRADAATALGEARVDGRRAPQFS